MKYVTEDGRTGWCVDLAISVHRLPYPVGGLVSYRGG